MGILLQPPHSSEPFFLFLTLAQDHTDSVLPLVTLNDGAVRISGKRVSVPKIAALVFVNCLVQRRNKGYMLHDIALVPRLCMVVVSQTCAPSEKKAEPDGSKGVGSNPPPFRTIPATVPSASMP